MDSFSFTTQFMNYDYEDMHLIFRLQSTLIREGSIYFSKVDYAASSNQICLEY